MSYFKFEHYTADELRACGERLIMLFGREAPRLGDGADPWADLMMNWFARACEDAVIDTSAPRLSSAAWTSWTTGISDELAAQPRRANASEFLQIDLCASRGPDYRGKEYWTRAHWDRVVTADALHPLLALEVEWKGKTEAAREVCAQHSAVKLAWVRALAKVLVSASHAPTAGGLPEIERWVQRVARIRAKTDDAAPWLVVDVAHGRAWDAAHHPRAWLITGASNPEPLGAWPSAARNA